MKLDAIRAIEACYAPGDQHRWAAGILEALAPASRGHGLLAFTYDCRGASRAEFDLLAEHGDVPPNWLAPFRTTLGTWPRHLLLELFRATPVIDFGSRRLGSLAGVEGDVDAFHRATGIWDSCGILAGELDGRGVMVYIPMGGDGKPPPRIIHQLEHVAAHLIAAHRLRLALDVGYGAVDAVLDPAGKIHHLEDGGASCDARERLGEAVRRVERARGHLRHGDPEEALALWRGLVDGSWSLVDFVDRDGRRFVLARRNAPGSRDPKAIAPRERDVLAYAALGHSNKYIGYLLGLRPSTVATHLKAAARKLGARSRAQLIQMFAADARDGAGCRRARPSSEARS